MCFPLLALLGTAVSVVGTIASAKAQQNEANYNAKVAEVNAATQRQVADSEANQISEKYDRMQATQRAAAAKAGVNIAAGSPSLIINQETARNSWLDQQSRIWSGETSAIADENKASQFRMQGKNAMTAGAFSAGSSFLSGLGGAMKSGALNIS